VIIVKVAWDSGRFGWQVRTECPGADPPEAWIVAAEDDTGRKWPLPDPGRRPESDNASWDRGVDELRDLSMKIAGRNATLAEAEAYGRHLFDALFGQESWKLVEDAHHGDGPLILALSWPADQGTLHRMVWELLHDGSGFLTIRAQRPVVPVRLVPSNTPAPSAIQSLPKVLFAVGTAITDHEVRAGTEFMGVLRGLEREGGAVQSRVLAKATETQLRDECTRLTPDIVHLIAHGRWDGQAAAAKLELRSDSGGTEEVTAERIADAVIGTGQHRHPPTVVIVSACQSGTTSHDAGVPMAARLVEEGIPLTVAMVGDVADTPCRVFTRSVADAIARGLPLTTAVADGRRAALLHTRDGAAPNTFDWALPALFASHPVLPDFRLVNAARINAVRKRIIDFDLTRPPLFCGRDEQLKDIDRLLDPADSLAVFVASTKREGQFGGTRLLRELAGSAIRDRHLPVFVGPFLTADAPKTLAALAREIGRKLVFIARKHGVNPPRRLLARSAGADPADSRDIGALLSAPLGQVNGYTLAEDVRADFTDLRDRLAEKHPEDVRTDATTLLLLDDVHWYDHALDELVKNLVPQGLGAAPTKLPVAIFGKSAEGAGACLTGLNNKAGSGWLTCHTLGHVVELEPDLNRLVFLWWLLHPEPETFGAPPAVLTPAPGKGDEWVDVLRIRAETVASFYDPESLGVVGRCATKHGWLTEGDDDAILQAYGMCR
jgi:hypothetical protein